MQSAITFCATNALPLYLDWNGSLLVDDELTVGASLNIKGRGRGTVLRETGTGKNLLRLTASITDARWESFTLSCDGDAGHVLCFGQVQSYSIASINTGTPSFTVSGTGAGSTIATGDAIRVRGGAGTNDRMYTVSGVTTGGGNTTITVLETINSSTAQGAVEWMEAVSFTRNLLLDLKLQQDNTANSILYGIWNDASGGMFGSRFDHIRLVGESGHVSPLIDLAASTQAIQGNLFTDFWAGYTGGQGTQYQVRLACLAASAYFDHNVFDNWVVENADGGCIHLIGCNHHILRNIQMYDNSSVTRDLIRLEKNADASPQHSRVNLLEMITRHDGTNASFNDIWIESNMNGNILNGCQGTPAVNLKIEFNSVKGVLIGNMFQTLSNAANITTVASS